MQLSGTQASTVQVLDRVKGRKPCNRLDFPLRVWEKEVLSNQIRFTEEKGIFMPDKSNSTTGEEKKKKDVTVKRVKKNQ